MKSLILAVSMLVSVWSIANNPTLFLPIDVKEALDLSNALDKNIFVYYYEDDCIFCNVANDSLFSNQNVRELLAQTYISVKANYRNSIYTSWYEKYKVTCLPTMQIISPKGDLIHEIKGVSSPKDFLDILGRFKELPIAEIEPVEDSTILEEAPSQEIASKEPAVPEDFHKEVQEISFFTIQLGAFRIFDNVINYRRELEKKLNASFSVYESNQDGLFRIFIGQHESRSDALNSLNTIKAKGLEYWLRGVEPSSQIFELEIQ